MACPTAKLPGFMGPPGSSNSPQIPRTPPDSVPATAPLRAARSAQRLDEVRTLWGVTGGSSVHSRTDLTGRPLLQMDFYILELHMGGGSSGVLSLFPLGPPQC